MHRDRAVMQWSHAAISQMPQGTIGVYAFWRRDNGKCIYVGQAKERPHQEAAPGALARLGQRGAQALDQSVRQGPGRLLPVRSA